MEYAYERRLEDIAPLLERLDRGEPLSDEEQDELEAIRKLYSDNWSGPIPAAIGNLTELVWFDLKKTTISDVTPLSGLESLKILHLGDTEVDDIGPLSDLKKLQELNLHGTHVSDLQPLSNLKALRRLDLSSTQISELGPLSGLKLLRYLDLGFTKVSDLHPLCSLKALEHLDISATQVSDFRPLSVLKALDCLLLSYSKINDLRPLANLKLLGRLDISSTQVSNLRPLSGLKSIGRLDFNHTQISDLVPISGFDELVRLGISDTKVYDLSPLIKLKKLKNLYLSDCNLREIPRELYERCSIDGLETVNLSTQPVGIFREKDKSVIRTYYNITKVPVREAKVIFLGDGGVGKTHTIERIVKKGRDECIETDPTLGISLKSYKAKGKRGKFSINFWDFGGQENMHAMHRCFLTDRTLYLVVINNRWDLGRQARYWLDNVHSFAPNSPVILAVNLWEGIHEFGLDTNRLQRDYPNLKWVAYYSAKGGNQSDFNALTQHIVDQAEQLDSNAMELPESWAAILQELRELAKTERAKSKKNNRKEKVKGHIDRDDYLELCTKHGLDGVGNQAIRSWLLEWFNDMGICFSYHRDRQTQQELGNYKVLLPEWLTSAIYILLNQSGEIGEDGHVKHTHIWRILRDPYEEDLARKDECNYILKGVKYTPEECEYILQIMRKFGLSYLAENKTEFIPALCTGEMPKDLYPEAGGDRISYEFRYSFLPDSVVQRLMVRVRKHKSFTKLWRKGFRSDEPDHGLITVVDAGGDNDKLRIDIYSTKENKGRDVMMWLITNIAAVNAELNLKPEQYIIVHQGRSEIAAPADMILQAKEQNYTTIPLYSKENGLVEKNVDEILGCTYGRQIIEAAQLVAKDDRRRLSEAVPQIINNYYVYGNIYNSSTPDGLLDLLERMAEQNVQVSRGFIDYLLEQIEGTEDENAKKLAADLKKEKGEGFLKKLSKGIKALTGLATGAKTLVTDGKAAYDAAKPIIDAVKLALLTQGPQIAEGAMEFFNLLPPG